MTILFGVVKLKFLLIQCPDLVVGSELHFAEELIGSYFTLRNPNAASTCGCGVSVAENLNRVTQAVTFLTAKVH